MSNTDEKSTEQPIWRDIDTAPKGRIYAAEYYPERKWWWMGEARWDEEAEGYLAIRGGSFREPSHWFPLPDDPDTQMRQMRDESAVIPADHDDLTTSKVISEQRPTPERDVAKLIHDLCSQAAKADRSEEVPALREKLFSAVGDIERQRDEAREEGRRSINRITNLTEIIANTIRERDEARAQRDEAVQALRDIEQDSEYNEAEGVFEIAGPTFRVAMGVLARIGKEGGE